MAKAKPKPRTCEICGAPSGDRAMCDVCDPPRDKYAGLASPGEPEVIERGGLPSWGGMDSEVGGGLGGDFEHLPSGF